MNINRILDGNNNSDSLTHTNTMSSNRTEHDHFHHRDRSKHILLLLIVIFICKCCAVTADTIEPPDCAGVVCDMKCPPDSKVMRIYGYDLEIHPSDAPLLNEDIIKTKQKRAIWTKKRESMKIVAGRQRREINDTLAIQQCCECKCDFTKCPEHKCPPNEYKITISQGTQSPGSCCPKFECSPQKPTCYSSNLRKHFNPFEHWEEDACTHCECTETAERNCETSICRTLSCEKKHYIDGECCPVCDINDSNFCEPDINCDIHCRAGFEYDAVRNCAICACAKAQRTTKKTTISENTDSDAIGSSDAVTTVGPSTWDTELTAGNGISTDPIDNTNASSTKPIRTEDSWYEHLPIVLGICITIGAFAVILSLTCRHISHKKDKHHLNRHQDKPLI